MCKESRGNFSNSFIRGMRGEGREKAKLQIQFYSFPYFPYNPYKEEKSRFPGVRVLKMKSYKPDIGRGPRWLG